MDPELVEKIDELMARPIPVVDENQASLWDDLVADSNAKADDAWRQYIEALDADDRSE